MALFKRNKKGALELSITAIVVLIIAITVLGLSIFFIKTLFKGGTEIFTGELAKIKDQLRSNMQESGELVIMSAGSEIEAKKGTPQQFYIGIKNTEKDSCFKISMKCLQPFGTDNTCPGGGTESVVVGGYESANGPRVTTNLWFPVTPPELLIKSGEIEVAPITMQIPSGVSDTYQMELDVYKVTLLGGETSCSGATYDELPWQPKRFYIILS